MGTSSNPNPFSRFNNRLGEIIGLASALILIVTLVTKQAPGPLPFTMATAIIVILFLEVCWSRWSKIRIEMAIEKNAISLGGKLTSKSKVQPIQFRLWDTINPRTQTKYQMSYRRRLLEFTLLLILFLVSLFWISTSRGDIDREIRGVPQISCRPSNHNPGLTILVARLHQVKGTPTLLMDRTFEAIAANIVENMRVCSVDYVVDNLHLADYLVRLEDVDLVVWGRIDAAFEIYVTERDLGNGLQSPLPSGNVLDNHNTPVFRLSSLDVLDNAKFQLEAPAEINLIAEFTVSKLLYKDNHVEEARKLLSKAILTAESQGVGKSNPSIMVEPYFFLGLLFDENISTSTPNFPNIVEAIKAYSRTIELDPLYYRAYLNRAFAYNRNNQIGNAIADYQHLIEDRSQFVLISHVNLATIYKEQGNRRKAEMEFTEAITSDPSDPNGYTSRGMANLDWNELPKAIDDFNEALKHAPYDPSRYNDLGGAQLLAGQTSDAVNTYQRVCPYLTPENRKEIINDLDQLAVDHPDIQLTINDIKLKLDQC